MANLKNEKIGIVGSGLIGKSWAMIFASEGFNVKLYDVDKNQVAKAIEVIIFIIIGNSIILFYWLDHDIVKIIKVPLIVSFWHQGAVYTHSFVLIRVSDLLTITSDL